MDERDPAGRSGFLTRGPDSGSAAPDAQEALDALREAWGGRAAHDFRGALTAIQASLELALPEVPPGLPALARKLELALAGAERLSGTTERVVEISRVLAGRTQPRPCRFDLAQVAGAALEQARPMLAPRALTLCAQGPVPAWGDPALVGRLLVHLLEEGRRAIGEQAGVRLEAALQGSWACLQGAFELPVAQIPGLGWLFGSWAAAAMGGRLERRQGHWRLLLPGLEPAERETPAAGRNR